MSEQKDEQLETLLPEVPEVFPVHKGITVLRGKTLTTTQSGWFKAVVEVLKGTKRQIRLYGWCKNKEGQYKLRQKFNISPGYAPIVKAVLTKFLTKESLGILLNEAPEAFPVQDGITVLRGRTLTTTPSGWRKAITEVSTGNKRQIRFFGWQKNQAGQYKKRQKFNVSPGYVDTLVQVLEAFLKSVKTSQHW